MELKLYIKKVRCRKSYFRNNIDNIAKNNI